MKLFQQAAKMVVAFGFCFTGIAQGSLVFNTSLASPGVYTGTGIPNTNYTVDTEGSLELGLTVDNRFGPSIDPGASSTYTVMTSAGPLASWDFGFSANTRVGGVGTKVVGNYFYTLQVQDLTKGTSGPVINPALIPDDSGYGSSGKTAGVNPVTQYGFQNYENPGFTGFLPGFNASSPDLYKITFSAQNLDLSPAASVVVFADARLAAAPEPGTFGLMGLAGVGAFLIAKRKRLIGSKT